MADKDYVTVATYCINDNWYGKRYRLIVSPPNSGFPTKALANKYKTKIKKYAINHKRIDKNIIDVDVVSRDTLVSYTYNSFGPSLYYKHIDISTDALDDWTEEQLLVTT